LSTTPVTVHLPLRAGVLQFVRVIDSATGKPVEKASLSLQRFDKMGALTLSQQGRLFVPAETKITVKVTADGYADWFYPGSIDASKATPIELRPSEHLPINISLLPAHQEK
jgi:hypothetical protein